MVPQSLRRSLARLRWGERGLRLTWGGARLFVIAAALMALACWLDWYLDRWHDTPKALRWGMLWAQVFGWVVAGLYFLVQPFFDQLNDTDLALYTEARVPRFGHRLVSAVQLNQRGADTRGMSPELIAAVTKEAEAITATVDFPQLLDRRRLRLSTALVAPVVLIAGLALAIWPNTVIALLGRQFLADWEIPRRVAIKGVEPDAGGRLVDAPWRVWRPVREDVVLRFLATGAVGDAEGELKITPVGQPEATYPLTRDPTLDTADALGFVARVPAPSAEFTYVARLDDGRTRKPHDVQLVLRPVIAGLDAWLHLPKAYELTPDTLPQKEGDIDGIPHAAAKLAVAVQENKQIRKAWVELLDQPAPRILAHLYPCGLGFASLPVDGLLEQATLLASIQASLQLPAEASPFRPEFGPEWVYARRPLPTVAEGRGAAGTFALEPRQTGYRVRVEDRHGFANTEPPRRNIRVSADPMPRVELLADRYVDPKSGLFTEVVEGAPVPFGDKFPVAYRCGDTFGLRVSMGAARPTAVLRYRVVRHRPNEEPVEGPWERLILKEFGAAPELGLFDLELGVFAKSDLKKPIEFYALPAVTADAWDRLAGGGRFDFHTGAIPDLRPGDSIEYYVEVFDRHPDPDRPPGRSELRTKKVLTSEEYVAWWSEKNRHEDRIRDLESKQRGVIGPGRSGP